MNIDQPMSRDAKKKTQRERLILAMLQQPSLQKAAAMAGLSEATAWRIRKTAEFEERYREMRHEIVAQSMARLQQGSGIAAQTLLKMLADTATPPSARIQAAAKVLEFANSSRGLDELEARVRELELIQIPAELRS